MRSFFVFLLLLSIIPTHAFNDLEIVNEKELDFKDRVIGSDLDNGGAWLTINDSSNLITYYMRDQWSFTFYSDLTIHAGVLKQHDEVIYSGYTEINESKSTLHLIQIASNVENITSLDFNGTATLKDIYFPNNEPYFFINVAVTNIEFNSYLYHNNSLLLLNSRHYIKQILISPLDTSNNIPSFLILFENINIYLPHQFKLIQEVFRLSIPDLELLLLCEILDGDYIEHLFADEELYSLDYYNGSYYFKSWRLRFLSMIEINSTILEHMGEVHAQGNFFYNNTLIISGTRYVKQAGADISRNMVQLRVFLLYFSGMKNFQLVDPVIDANLIYSNVINDTIMLVVDDFRSNKILQITISQIDEKDYTLFQIMGVILLVLILTNKQYLGFKDLIKNKINNKMQK